MFILTDRNIYYRERQRLIKDRRETPAFETNKGSILGLKCMFLSRSILFLFWYKSNT